MLKDKIILKDKNKELILCENFYYFFLQIQEVFLQSLKFDFEMIGYFLYYYVYKLITKS